MHTFGKVCLWSTVVLSLVAIVLTAKLFKNRAHFVKQKLQYEEKIEKNRKDLYDLRRTVRQTHRDLTHELLGWNPYWNDVPVNIFDQNNSVEIGIGTQHGLKPEVDPNDPTKHQLVYCFQQGENGEYWFVGDFRVVTVGGDVATLEPNWKVSAEEAALWSGEKSWRIRSLVPSQHQVRFHGLELHETRFREELASKQSDLAKQKQLLAMATERRDQRVAEIDGPTNGAADLEHHLRQNLPGDAGAGQGGNADAKNRPREDVVGLITALEEAEEQRNAIVAEADRLRRELLQTLTDFERTQAENLQIVESMRKNAVHVRRRPKAGSPDASVTSR